MQGGFVRTDPCVTADQVQLTHRDIEHRMVGVFQVQKLLKCWRPIGILFAQVHVDQASVAAYAMGVVHHRVAEIEFGQVFDE